MEPVPSPPGPPPSVRITDPREPSLEERLRTPTSSLIYSATGMDLCTEAAEMIESLTADNEALRKEVNALQTSLEDHGVGIDELTVKLQNVNAENQRQRDYCSEVERNRDELYHENERLQEERRQRDHALNLAREELRSMSEENARLVRENVKGY